MKFLFLLLLSVLMLPAFSQVEFSLDNKKPELDHRNFNIIQVIDSRPVTSRIGIVQTGVFNAIKVADLKGGSAKEIKRFLDFSFPYEAGKDSVVLNILELKVDERTYMTKELGHLYYQYELYYYSDSVFYRVLVVQNQIECRGLDVTLKHEKNIRASLETTLQQLTKINLREHVFIAPQARPGTHINKGDYPISNATELKKGIYRSLVEFRQNAPSLAYEFDMRQTNYGKQPRSLGTRPMFNNDKGEPVMVQEEVWGYCDGKTIYVLHNNDYFPVLNNNGIFEFWGTMTVRQQTGASGIMGAITEGIQQRVLFQIDLQNGKFVRM